MNDAHPNIKIKYVWHEGLEENKTAYMEINKCDENNDANSSLTMALHLSLIHI